MSPFSGACPRQLSRYDSEAPVAAESDGAGAVGAGLGFVDIKRPALNVLAVQGGYGNILHSHSAPAGLASVFGRCFVAAFPFKSGINPAFTQ